MIRRCSTVSSAWTALGPDLCCLWREVQGVRCQGLDKIVSHGHCLLPGLLRLQHRRLPACSSSPCRRGSICIWGCSWLLGCLSPCRATCMTREMAIVLTRL